MRRRDWALRVAAVLAVPLALALIVLAVAVLRLPGALASHDARFESAPLRQAGLWDALDPVPGRPADRLLELEDDLDYRRAAALYLRAEPGKVNFQGVPELEALRSAAQFEVTRTSREDPDPHRRAQLLVLYGVISLDRRSVSEDDRQDQIRGAADAFRAALALDPANEDAKLNLEMVLSLHGPVALPGNAPSQGRAEGNVSGQGRSGSGY